MCGGVAVLGLLAALSVVLSDMPAPAAWPLAGAAAIGGIWRAWREATAPVRHIVWNCESAQVTVDSVPVQDARVDWRGPLVVLTWTDPTGAGRTLVWLPDTLSLARRRELRLAVGAGGILPVAASMAP